jgi:hypothetical protein
VQQLVAATPVEAAAQLTEQVDGFPAGEVGPEADVARHVRQPAVQADRVAPRVGAEHLGVAGVAAEQPEQDPDGGGLSGAVGPEEAVHLPLLDPQIQPVECPDRAERLDQVADRDDGHRPSCRWLRRSTSLY